MGVLDERRLAVALSPFEACEGLRRWPITGEAGPVGMVQRVGWGPGRVISGLRHRLPQEVVELDGSVSVRVGRSRQPRGRVTSHAVHRPDHALIGRVHTTAGPTHDVVDAEGVAMARLAPATENSGSWLVDGSDPGFEPLQLSVTPPETGWTIPQVWALTGFDGLTDPLRLLTVAAALVIAPWWAAEAAATAYPA